MFRKFVFLATVDERTQQLFPLFAICLKVNTLLQQRSHCICVLPQRLCYNSLFIITRSNSDGDDLQLQIKSTEGQQARQGEFIKRDEGRATVTA